MPKAEQKLAIAPSEPGHRKVVLATSIAQTSLTIEGVRIVVDSGLARRAKFDPRSGMTQLVTTKVSRDAADQRRGRAGRLGPGVCYRLWAQEAGRTLAPFTPPQIFEADLCPLALELANWGVADPDRLRWLTPPPAAAFAQARDLLSSLGALDAAGRISAQGRVIAQPGVHPRLAHMLIKAQALGLQRLASEVAALLSERDVLKFSTTARAADVRLRLEVVRGIRDHLPTDAVVDRGAVERVRKLAGSWRTQLAAEPESAVIQSMDCSNKEVAKTSRPGLPDSSVPTGMTALVHADELENTGLLLALAYPDRVARSRAELTGRYQLSNGRGAFLTEGEPLAREEFLGVADLDAAEREARIYLAAPVTRGQIEHAFRDRIRVVETVAWDSRAEAVAARREERLDRILIHAAALEDIDPQLAVNAMLEGVRALGLSALPWDRETRAWRARVLFLRRLNGGDWPDVADAHLLASLESWLAPWLAGITRREHLARLDLRAALRALLTRAQQQRLDEWAPTHLAVPSGSRIALDYTHADGPVLAARLQELFGLRETPRIAGGRIPVIIQALSPAGRPVQVTRDLASFWSKGYHDVRKDLKGRYPKHYWPDDPVTAVATRKVRP
ncbi:MAG: ATP-dependent helicase HrpB, partial [Chromatiales bacterium]